MFWKKKNKNSEEEQERRRAKSLRTQNELNEVIYKTDDKIQALVNKACEAKKNGQMSSYSLAKKGIASALSIRKHALNMLTQLSVIEDIREISSLGVDFVAMMEDACDDIIATKGTFKVKKLTGKMAKALKIFDGQKKSAEELSESTDIVFDATNIDMPYEMESEIDKMIEQRMESEEIADDEKIEKQIAKLKTTGQRS